MEERLKKIRIQDLRQKQRYESGEPLSKRFIKKFDKKSELLNENAEAHFVLDEYHSDDENGSQPMGHTGTRKQEGLSATSMNLMEKLGMFAELSTEKGDMEPTDETKIYYCSRTHSQLTQFIHEMRKVKLRPPSWLGAAVQSSAAEQIDPLVVKHLPLASRKNLCINQKVSKLGSAVAINERCLELQRPDVPQNHKCTFLPTKENESLVNDFRDHTLAKIRDIEDLGTIGKNIGICPYYAARATVKPSEASHMFVTLPYPLLLQKFAREALEISLKGHVIIIDEAHNLMDAISNIYSIVVTQSQVNRCRHQLRVYLQKFRNQLKGKNRVYITQVVRLLDSVSACIENTVITNGAANGSLDVGEILAGKGVDQINLFKLMHYLGESRLARKVEAYATFTEEQEQKSILNRSSSSIPVLTHVQTFFQTLTNPTSEGRFFYEKNEGGEISLKYMLLDPTYHFREIVENAKAVILAGGTMSPMDDYVRHLFAYVNPDRLKLWSCGHIIPKENLIVWPVARGSSGIDFDFTYSKRDSPSTIDVLGQSLFKISTVIPDGVVVFFPSYSYLDQVVLRWQKGGSRAASSIWDRLSSQKTIFQESKDAVGVDDVLGEYTKAIGEGRGSLLLSVIGGKMSEGINFSDKLGRGVIAVGLPFPNMQSAQWKAKIEYIEKSVIDQGGSKDAGKAAGRDFYENACMRAVNQSIGRAIRHQNDFASIILLDRRYKTERITSKLPGWIRQSIVQSKGDESFHDVIDSLETFFQSKRDC
ncbi:ATP-dependent DNA helicase chl1 [Sticta canariensis]|nr:ATP-dependent DNA helicase chl1 [Sticta canariensis]